MKKKLFFVILCALILSGCVNQPNSGTPGTVSIMVGNNNYQVSAANLFAKVNLNLFNNLSNSIYFENVACGNPIKVYQLSDDNKWQLRTDLENICLTLAPSTDKPTKISAGESYQTSKNVSKSGTYKMEFEYYLDEQDYKNKTNAKKVSGNQFQITQENATINSVISACQKKDSRESRVVECLYVAAKNIAVQDLDLAIDLCKEIDKIGHGFDGCYDGVAIILRDNNKQNKINTVCQNYIIQERIQKCLDLAK